jgi:tetratricopeptide (TPR) repeat protein
MPAGDWVNLSDQLNLLHWHNFLKRTPAGGEVEYMFHHPLAQEVAYGTLLRADRLRLHRATGEALEALYPDRLPELAPQLAHHFREAGDDPRALHYSALAGTAALANFANAEAESHFRHALELARDPAQCAGLLSQIGEALLNQSRFDDAIQAWREAIDYYRNLSDFDNAARLYARSARAAGAGGMGGDVLRSLELCWEGLDVTAGQPESAGQAALLHEMGRACYFSGLHDDARDFVSRAVAMAERVGDRAVQADAMATLWGTMLYPPDECVIGLHQAIELARQAGRLETVSRAYHNLGSSLGFMLGDMQAGVEHILQAADVDRLRGNHAEEFYSLRVAAGMAWMAGDLARVEAITERQRGLLRLIPDPQRERVHLRYMDMVLPWLRGDVAEALRRWRRLAGTDLPFGDRIGAADLLIEAGELQAADGLLCQGLESDKEMVGVTMRTQLSLVRARQACLEDARRLLAEARQVPSEWGMMDEMYLAMTEAQLALAEGRWEEALAAYKTAADVQAQGGMRWYEARTLRDWAEALLVRGGPGARARALELLADALAEFEGMGAAVYAEAVRQRMQELGVRGSAHSPGIGRLR